MPVKRRENVPNARRTLEALRNLGYSFNLAVADLIDNSIMADASAIHVEFRRQDETFHLSVCDNGRGMTEEQLDQAMRLGSDSDYETGSLGKYGFGMKTASISQCRSLTVVSKTGSATKPLALRLDLDDIHRTNRWEIIEVPTRLLRSYPQAQSVVTGFGTAVIWDKLDILTNEYDAFSSTRRADNWFGRILAELQLHLRMVFHRFIDGSARRRVTIHFNGTSLTPWDPFCRQEKHTQPLDVRSFAPSESESRSSVRVEPYILPVKDGPKGFSSLTAWQEASGLMSWNDSQGYYVYREDRLIRAGGWLRTRAKDEHTKYARVGIFFPADLDDIFSITVHKAQLRLPPSLLQYLRDEANPNIIKAAQVPYREGARRGQTGTRHARTTRMVNQTAPSLMKQDGVAVLPGADGKIRVRNPRGGYDANTQAEALRLNIRERFVVQTGDVPDGGLWRLVCKTDGGFAVILNPDHPFYKSAYDNGQLNGQAGALVDSVLIAMAYAELRTASTGTLPLFSEIRHVVSRTLEDLVTGAVPVGASTEGDGEGNNT